MKIKGLSIHYFVDADEADESLFDMKSIPDFSPFAVLPVTLCLLLKSLARFARSLAAALVLPDTLCCSSNCLAEEYADDPALLVWGE